MGTTGRGRKRQNGLTERQRKTLKTFQRLLNAEGRAPTYQELADTMGVTVPSVYNQVMQLVGKGYLARDEHRHRGLKLLRNETGPLVTTSIGPATNLVRLPVVGQVAAGVPTLAEEHISGEIMVEADTIGSGRHFALNVAGESMIGADIKDGDVVIVHEGPLANDGDIVVALVDDEATVKRLEHRDGQIRLMPENPDFKPISITGEAFFQILGKVVGICRSAG